MLCQLVPLQPMAKANDGALIGQVDKLTQLSKITAQRGPEKRKKCRVGATRLLCAMLSKNRMLALQFEALGLSTGRRYRVSRSR